MKSKSKIPRAHPSCSAPAAPSRQPLSVTSRDDRSYFNRSPRCCSPVRPKARTDLCRSECRPSPPCSSTASQLCRHRPCRKPQLSGTGRARWNSSKSQRMISSKGQPVWKRKKINSNYCCSPTTGIARSRRLTHLTIDRSLSPSKLSKTSLPSPAQIRMSSSLTTRLEKNASKIPQEGNRNHSYLQYMATLKSSMLTHSPLPCNLHPDHSPLSKRQNLKQ